MSTLAKRLLKYISISKLPYEVKLPFTHVVQVGDPVLRTVACQVDKDEIQSPPIQEVIKTMKSIMINDSLTGISACQIGIPISIIAFQVPTSIIKLFTLEQIRQMNLEEIPPQVWINPELKVLDYTASVMPEMCCSIVSLSADVKRHKRISLCGLDENGNIRSMEASEFVARIIQHEMDHLKGTMFTDIMNPKTLKNILWGEINELNGYVELNYYPKA